WCVRQHVLAAVAGEKREAPILGWRTNAIFLHGWRIHERWQDLFQHSGLVVMSGDQAELDLTHYDEDRGIYFSPDAIIEFGGIRYVVEIKGINHDNFVLLSDDLQESMRVNNSIRTAVPQANLYMHLLELQK